MAKYVFLVLVDAVDGRDDELNDFLDNVHIPEFIRDSGATRCTRYQVAPEEANNPKATRRYMHMYEVETDDLAKVKEMAAAAKHLRTPLSPAMDGAGSIPVWYKAR